MNSSGEFILTTIMESNDLNSSKLALNSVLFFFIFENTGFSAALLCGVVRTDKAISPSSYIGFRS